MHYAVMRDCLLDRLYAKGECVSAEAAMRWPEHVEAIKTDKIDSGAGNQHPNEKVSCDEISEPGPGGIDSGGGILGGGVSLESMTRGELRAWAARHHPGAKVPWGRKADMAEAVRRLCRGR